MFAIRSLSVEGKFTYLYEIMTEGRQDRRTAGRKDSRTEGGRGKNGRGLVHVNST